MIGAFASSSQNSYGIGKIVAINKETVTLEYFISISNRLEKQVAKSSIASGRPGNQTRCYVWSKETETWWAGRIGARDVSDRTYEVSFPNNIARYVPEKEVYVRCRKPVEDPTETLALRGHETPYFHDRRLAFINCITAQRAKALGMTGLLSSNIHLYPHQTEVIRRILEDPVQRYLLADEVGLGKTIEAGVVLRQYLLDERAKSAIVLVPDTLVEQWEIELEEKFSISDFGSRVEVISTASIRDRTIRNSDNLGFLIIDEAHHIAAGAHDLTASERWTQFQICKGLAHSAERLLLLSATPVLHNENNFLSMLHLLDPITYQLEAVEAFRERVSKRQDIGRILLSFGENSATFVIKTTLNRLLSMFPNDLRLKVLVTDLQLLFESNLPDLNKQKHLVRSIRTHISDSYRLHRRMLRNRRESVNLPRRLDAARSASDLKEEYDEDSRGQIIHDLVDDWRGYALQHSTSLEERDDQSTLLRRQTQQVFTILVRASGSWLGVLEKVLLVRLSQSGASTIGKDFTEVECELVANTPHFPGEIQLLRRMLEVVQQPPSQGEDRIQLLRSMLQRIQSSGTKAVVFTSFESSQLEIVRALRHTFGDIAIASHDSQRPRVDIDEDRRRFHEKIACFVLVSDSSGEEGLNLQVADWIIHFDLPWSPNRLEQRIGRLDRIGRDRSVKTRTLLGPQCENTLYDAWYRMLKDGLGIFRTSIASLQFYIDRKMPSIEATLFDDGSAGLLHIIPEIQSEIESEEIKINEQNALDEIDMLDGSSKRYFAELQKYDGQHEEIQKAYDDWTSAVLRFDRHYEKSPDIISYTASDNTLIPKDVLLDQFASIMAVPGTYNRATAVRHPGNRLFRIGEPFTQALARQVRFDDRGQAFMMWRHHKDWNPDENSDWAGFRFNYIVEANLKGAKQILLDSDLAGTSIKALSRRADGMFPPFTHSKFLDLNLQEVVDEGLLNILALRYFKDGSSRCDYNINFQRFAAVSHLIDPQHWGDLCKAARAKSEELVRESPKFQKFCKSYALSTKKEMTKRIDQLRLRAERRSDTGMDSRVLSNELALEVRLQSALVRGIIKPQLRLDSVGFIVIAGRPPF